MIAVIGGGISGLTAAFELSRRGVPFRLFEASSRTGGLIQTDRFDGFTIDAGADSMLSNKPAARQLCEQVGLTSRLQDMLEPRTAFVYDGRRLFPLPSRSALGLPLTPGAALGFTLLPFTARLRVLFEPYVQAGTGADETIASFFSRRFGPATVARVAQPLLGGIHAGDVERLSVRSLFPSLIEAEAGGGVLRSLGRRGIPQGGMFTSLSEGMDSLPQTISRSLPTGVIRNNMEVRAITPVAGGWRVDTSLDNLQSSAVILATPVHVTARLLRTVDGAAAAAAAEIPHASTVSIALGYRRDAIPHALGGSGFVVARDAGLRVTACTWVSSKWEGRAPAGSILLRAFAGGVHDPDAIGLEDDELVALARQDVGRVLGVSAAPRIARVYRWRDASPQLNVGHDERVARIVRGLERRPGIFVTGRGFRAVGIPDCIADARQIAAAAAEYLSSEKEHVRVN